MKQRQFPKKHLITLLLMITLFLAIPQATFAAKKPVAVKNLKCGATTNGSINISWSTQSGVSGYQVYRATSYDGPYQRLITLSAGNRAFCNLKLQSGREYYYKVRAYVKQGSRTVNGKFSKTLVARTKGASRAASIRTTSNVRKHAGTNHTVTAVLNAGTRVTVICATNDKSGAAWSRISFTVNGKKKTGYIRSDLLTTSSQPQPQPPRNKTGVVTASSLRLRRSASTNSAIITSLPNGTVVTILGQTTGTDRQKWYHISVKRNGRTLKGYAAARYIRVS